MALANLQKEAKLLKERELAAGVHKSLFPDISKLPKESKELKIKQFDDLIQRHKKLWIQRSRPGGLDESIRFLNRGREMIMV